MKKTRALASLLCAALLVGALPAQAARSMNEAETAETPAPAADTRRAPAVRLSFAVPQAEEPLWEDESVQTAEADLPEEEPIQIAAEEDEPARLAAEEGSGEDPAVTVLDGDVTDRDVTLHIENGVLTGYTRPADSTQHDLVIPEGVTSINRNVFYTSSKSVTHNWLRSVTLPASLEDFTPNYYYFTSYVKDVTLTNPWLKLYTAIPNDSAVIHRPATDDTFAVDKYGCITGYKGPGGEVTIPKGATLKQPTSNYGAGLPFYRNTTITKIVLPEGMTEIPGDSFQGCTALREVVLPASIKTIGDEAFQGCTRLAYIHAPEVEKPAQGVATFPEDGVTTLGENAFSGCSALTELTLPHSLTSMGKACFASGYMSGTTYYNSGVAMGLKRVTLGAGLRTLPNYAFADCTNLTSVTFSEGLVSITEYVFRYCFSLKSLTLPSTLQVLSPASCDGSFVSSITVPENCQEYIQEQVDEVLAKYIQRVFPSTNGTLTGYNGPDGAVVIPAHITAIGQNAFKNKTGVTSVTFHSGVTAIEKDAFAGCTALNRVSGLDGLASLAKGAFAGCAKLVGKSIPYALISGPACFVTNNGTLTDYTGLGGDVTVPDEIQRLASGAFSGVSIPHLTLPSTLLVMERGAVADCQTEEVIIPASVTDIDPAAFTEEGHPVSALTVHGAAGSAAQTWAEQVWETAADFKPAYPFLADQAWTVSGEAAKHTFTVKNGVWTAYAGPGGTVTADKNIVTAADPTGISPIRKLTLLSGVKRVTLTSNTLETLSLPDTVTDLKLSTPNLRELSVPESVTSADGIFDTGRERIEFAMGSELYRGMRYQDFAKLVQKSPKLEIIANCPSRTLENHMLSNLSLREIWDPASSVTQQSSTVTELSERICRGLTSDRDKARAISRWVVNNIEYDYDHAYAGLKDYSDVPFSPEEVLDAGMAVCAGYARLTQALLEAQYIPCLYVTGWTPSGNHAWNLAWVDGDWMWLDNTWGMGYFDMGTACFSVDHVATGAAIFDQPMSEGPTALEPDLDDRVMAELDDERPSGALEPTGIALAGTARVSDNGDGTGSLSAVLRKGTDLPLSTTVNAMVAFYSADGTMLPQLWYTSFPLATTSRLSLSGKLPDGEYTYKLFLLNDQSLAPLYKN